MGFRYASDANQPLIWKTVPYVGMSRLYGNANPANAAEPDEVTLSSWFIAAQSSFHGGAGNLNLERVDIDPTHTHIRFYQSKNVDALSYPGKLMRLPDTTRKTTDTSASMAPLSYLSADYAIYVNQAGKVKLLNVAAGSSATFTGITATTSDAVASNGQQAFAISASDGSVWRVDPSAIGSATKIATFTPTTTAAIGWVKGRLMIAAGQSVYELDSTVGSPVALGATQLRYTHPVPKWQWRCFAESPSAVLAAGDAGSHSEIVEFGLVSDAGIPTLAVSDVAMTMPPGEQVLSMQTTMASFLALGTTKGIRIAQFGSAYSASDLSQGPLTLPVTETQFPVAAIAARDRFVFAAGLAVDEPGLVRVDLGSQTDQAGRFSYCTDLIPAVASLAANPVTSVITLPSGLLLFSVPTYGIVVEGVGSGTARTAWLTTSRIRYNTTEPKLFKLAYLRGDFLTSSVKVQASISTGASVIKTVGFIGGDPDDFTLPPGPAEWLSLTLTLTGATANVNSYGVKALPGTKRQRALQVTVAVADRETDRLGHRSIDLGSARNRVEALFELSESADETIFQEFSLYGEKQTVVVIDDVQFAETARPTPTSDFGGQLTILMRTVS